jgi:DNA gyrase subunit B
MAPRREAPGDYSADNIVVLSDTAHIRLRPSMYIGSTDARGLHYLVQELLHLGLTECRAGFATQIEVELLGDGGLTWRDDGRGISVAPLPRGGRGFLEALLAQVTVSPRWPEFTSAYSCGSDHAIGLVTANALGEQLLVEVCRDGQRWRAECRRGELLGPLVGTPFTGPSGTSITFRPDPSIFSERTFSFDDLATWLDTKAALFPGLQVRLTDSRTSPARSVVFHHPSGMADLLPNRVWGERPVHQEICSVRIERGKLRLDAAILWVHARTQTVWSSVNTDPTTTGTHVQGLLDGVARVLIKRLRPAGRGTRRCIADDTHEGLRAVVSVWHPEPWLQSPTRDRLANPEVADFVDRHVSAALDTFLDAHPEDAAAILAHVARAREARLLSG